MYGKYRIGAVIAAGGLGSRMNKDIPKQFIKTGGKTILAKAVDAFASSDIIDSIVIVLPHDFIETGRSIIEKEVVDRHVKIKAVVEGGKDRQASVYNGITALMEASPDTDHILIHDGARPYVSKKLIERVTAAAVDNGACVPVIGVKDTIMMDGTNLERSRLKAVQTPQGFSREIITEAYRMAKNEGRSATDDAGLVQMTGRNVCQVDGEEGNIKITVAEDLPSENRVGTGFDVHAFEKGRRLVLGGVTIKNEQGLAGHSDADVLTHAVMDAILGAAGLGDIGRHFPDSDDAYKDISSMKLLVKVCEMIKKEGYTIGNIDVTLICERPKISPYADEMEKRVAKSCGISQEAVNIKGTTTEGLGFTGKGEGIAAKAVCIIIRN